MAPKQVPPIQYVNINIIALIKTKKQMTKTIRI